MQPQTTSRPAFSYAPFYEECARYPELPKFRRFAEQWAKKLYDDVEELLVKERELNDALAEFRKAQGRVVLKTIECPRSLVKEDQGLQKKWKEYEDELRSYSQDLCLSHQLFTLPTHAPYFSRRLKEYKNLFHNGEFGPTGEKNAAAAEYQDLTSPDFVAWVGIPNSDTRTNLYVNHSDWVENTILRRLRALLHCHRPASYGSQLTSFRVSTIVHAIDILTCVFVPLLLTATMFALVVVRPLKARIASVGVFGLVFSISAKAISGRISRGEIFAYSAAFFAVASVFVSATNDNGPMKS